MLAHLLLRIHERNIFHKQIILLACWLDAEPVAPEGRWFRKFAGFTLCGEGELIKTFLLPGQLPDGVEII